MTKWNCAPNKLIHEYIFRNLNSIRKKKGYIEKAKSLDHGYKTY